MVGCGGDSHEQAADDLIDLTAEVGAVLENVEDKDSAEKAKEKLVALADDFRAVGKRLNDLGQPEEGLEEQLEEKYSDRLKEITENMGVELQRIMQIDVSLMPQIQEGMDEIGKAMEEAAPQWTK
jgi:hypothetical protein